jgi:hypothetical protein
MLDALKYLAANHLARRTPRQRAGLQAALDKWNADAGAWLALSRQRPCKAIKRHPWTADLRGSMEWALADGNIADARRFAGFLSGMVGRLGRTLPESREVRGFVALDIAFPATLEAMVEDFDRREYSEMMRGLRMT